MDKHQTFLIKIGNYPRKSVAFFDSIPRKSVIMNLLNHAVLGRFLRFFEAYHRKSVVFVGSYPRKSVVFVDFYHRKSVALISFYHRKSVVLISFYHRKSVSLQCKLLNVRLL